MSSFPTISTLAGLMSLLLLLRSGSPPEAAAPAPETRAEVPVFWGANGHRIVGEIAQHYLSDAARAQVRALVGDTSLAQLSTWADEIRSNPAWDCAQTWHYVTIDDGLTYATARKNRDGDIIEAMKRHEETLRDPATPMARKREALKFLVHFVGDVHQPLHVGRGADRGGNSVTVFWFGEQTNLHSVWDTKIIEQKQLSFTEYTRFIDHPAAADVTAWQNSSCLNWAEESAALRDELYSLADITPYVDREGRFNLSYAYAYQKAPLVNRRLLQGGVRLAGLLNAIFGGSAPTTCNLPEIQTVAEQCPAGS